MRGTHAMAIAQPAAYPLNRAAGPAGQHLVGEPTVVVYRGLHVSVFAVAPDGRVQHLLWNGHAWVEEWLDPGGSMRHSPAVFRWVAT